MAFKSKYPLMEWSAIKEYMNQNRAYKDEARQLITKQLGFAPNLQASRSIELGLRHSLKLLDKGEISRKKLQRELYNATLMVQRNILRYVPEQAHRINANVAGRSFIRT